MTQRGPALKEPPLSPPELRPRGWAGPARGGRVRGSRGDRRRLRREPEGVNRQGGGRESAKSARSSPAQPTGAHGGARAPAQGWRTPWPGPGSGRRPRRPSRERSPG